MTVTLKAEAPSEDVGAEYKDLCTYLLPFAYSSQVPRSKWRALVNLPPLRRSSHYKQGLWNSLNTWRQSPEIRKVGMLLTNVQDQDALRRVRTQLKPQLPREAFS